MAPEKGSYGNIGNSDLAQCERVNTLACRPEDIFSVRRRIVSDN